MLERVFKLQIQKTNLIIGWGLAQFLILAQHFSSFNKTHLILFSKLDECLCKHSCLHLILAKLIYQ